MSQYEMIICQSVVNQMKDAIVTFVYMYVYIVL